MRNTIQPFPILTTSPGWLPVAASAGVMLAGFLLAVATVADVIGWQ